MNKVKSQKRPSRSLRNSLIFWFLVFSIVPLIFVTGFSLEKAELALDRELLRRMQGNTNEVDLTISDMEKAVTSRGRDLASDRALTYYLSTNKAKEIRSFLSNWIMSSVASRVSVIQADGRIIGSAYKDETGEVKSENLSSEKAYYIEDDLVERLNATVSLKLLESRKKSLELVAYQQVQSRSGRVVGFIEQVININEQFLLALKKRMELQLVIISPEGKVVVASNEDLMLYPKKFFAAFKGDNEEKIYDIQIRKQPY